ncbi:hypothetical protein BH09PSE5_BH09PSE5_43920 [soil metagenome]
MNTASLNANTTSQLDTPFALADAMRAGRSRGGAGSAASGATSSLHRVGVRTLREVDPAFRVEAQFARRVAARLDEISADVPHDVSERLRFARGVALEKARLARIAEAAASAPSLGNAILGGSTSRHAGRTTGKSTRWWVKVVAVVPLIALVGGLVLIQRLHVAAQIKAAAEIDAALLADDLPPAAYTDPAFAEFLRAPRD